MQDTVWLMDRLVRQTFGVGGAISWEYIGVIQFSDVI